jgi:hypothetical protein
MADKTFSYPEACALLEQVRRLTLAADERVQQLRAQIDAQPKGSPQAERLEEQMNAAVQHWAAAMLELGVLPKGVWTVDFDSGEGFHFCWSLNERTLGHWHAYDEGFQSRKPLVDGKPASEKPPILN